MPDRHETLGVGLAGMLPCDDVLDLPARHPLTTPGFTLAVDLVGGPVDPVVVAADATCGLMHRGAEKLFEARDYRQAMLLANRHDWLSSFCGELTVARAAEDALGIVPPLRATWARTLVVEAQRAAAALAFLAPIAGPASAAADRLREEHAVALAIATGARVHPGFARVGGVAHAIPDDALTAYDRIRADTAALHEPLRAAVAAYADRFAGVAALSREQAIAFGTSGIVARASGLDLDLRRDEPDLAYGELTDVVGAPVRSAGDVPARYELLVSQVVAATGILAACVERLRALGPGPIDVPLPKVVRLPEGTTYARLEGPLGVCGAFVVSTGEKTPWRLKIRSASFASMQAMTVALAGVPRSALADAVMSFPVVIGDVDR